MNLSLAPYTADLLEVLRRSAERGQKYALTCPIDPAYQSAFCDQFQHILDELARLKQELTRG